MNPNSVLSINAVEGFPLEDFSIEAVRSQIAESQKVASGNGNAQEIAEANIEIEVSHTILYAANWQITDWVLGSGESAGCA
jgi:F-type H+-transporting ATPase subunit delta